MDGSFNVAQKSGEPTGLGRLYVLAAGTFAVGTEGFMIAGILPRVASDLHVSPATAGQLVTAFALSYAVFSPILTALTGHFARRTVLLWAMGAFAVVNALAALAPNFQVLLVARIGLAMAAGVFVPGANALAGALVPPERRGVAIAIVNAGLTISIALGVPIGTALASMSSWRATFVGVAMLATAAFAGLLAGLPVGIGAHFPVASLRERIRVARKPEVLLTLLGTTLWATGSYVVYTYLSLFLGAATNVRGANIGYVLFATGVAAGVGVILGGRRVDRLGARAVIVPALMVCAMSFVALSMFAHTLSPSMALVPILAAIIMWSLSHWGFYPGQQARLMGIAGLHLAPIALSLNASFMYLGFSVGAAAGGLLVAYGSALDLGYLAAAFAVASLLLMSAISQSRVGASA
jgi:predicted MFS family arabinose efflux permease